MGLGVWQMQRKVWKEGLLARIEALKTAPAEPLEVVLRRVADRVDIEYVRVQAACPPLETLPTLRLYAVKDGMIGYRLIAACPISAEPYASILVDRGFIPARGGRHPPATAGAAAQPIVGILRKGDAGRRLHAQEPARPGLVQPRHPRHGRRTPRRPPGARPS